MNRVCPLIMLPILAAAALLTSPANAQQVNPGPNPGAPLWPLLPLATVTAPVDAVAPWHYHSARRADVVSRYYAAQRPWHGPYAYTQWGTPVALVVPPNSKMHTSWSWGVSQSEMIPIYHQFHRDYPGGLALGGGAQINPTPYWPSHTDQFGVYPVRGPW